MEYYAALKKHETGLYVPTGKIQTVHLEYFNFCKGRIHTFLSLLPYTSKSSKECIGNARPWLCALVPCTVGTDRMGSRGSVKKMFIVHTCKLLALQNL